MYFFFQYTLLGKKTATSWSQPANAGMHSCTCPERVKSYHHWKHIQNVISSWYCNCLLWMLLNLQNIITALSFDLQFHPWNWKQKTAQGKIWKVRVVWGLQSFLSFPWTSGQACCVKGCIVRINQSLPWLITPHYRLGGESRCTVTINQPLRHTVWCGRINYHGSPNLWTELMVWQDTMFYYPTLWTDLVVW